MVATAGKNRGLSLNGTYIDQVITTPRPEAEDVWATEPEVTTVNYRSANIWWGGETQRDYSQTRARENFRNCFDIGYDSEQLVFTQEDHRGKLVRMWLNKDRNVTAKVTYSRLDCAFKVEIYYNERNSFGRWQGQKVATHLVHRTVTDEAELTVSEWVVVWFAKAQAQAGS